MKKLLIAFLGFIMCLTLTSCDFFNNDTTKKTYTVTFLNWDNTLLYQATGIEKGQPAIYGGEKISKIEINGATYEFIGWDKDISAIYSDLTVFAKYSGFENNNTQTGTTLDKIKLARARTTIEKKSEINLDDIVQFRDDNYYYFVFDLGEYHNIPIESTYDYCTYGGYGDVTRTMTASSATSTTIENSTTSTYEASVDFTCTEDYKYSESVGLKAPSEGGFEASLGVEYGYSTTLGISTSASWSNSYSETSTYSESESRTTSISFKSGDPAGKYYYYLSVDTKVYGTIIKSISTGEYFITIKSSIIGRGFNYLYCGDDNLKFECDDKLEFDYGSIIEKYNLDNIIPANYTGTKKEDDGKIHIQNVTGLYKALKDAKATDYLVLDNDIDCTDYPWTPLDNFYGQLNGNGYAIKNLTLTINSGNSDSLIGMFKELSGTINTLKIDNLKFNIHKYHDTIENIYVGAICGRLTGGKIELCEIENSNIYAYHDSDDKKRKTRAFVGGYVGELSSGTIISCQIKKTDVYGKTRINYDTKSEADCWSYVGGFVGHLCGGEITDCIRYNDVNVTAYTLSGSKTSAFHCHVGGIAGYKDSGTISNCNSTETGLTKTTEVINNRKANSSSSGLGSETGN